MARLVPLVALAVVLVACGGVTAMPGLSSLSGRTFLSTSLVRQGAEAPLVPGTRIRLDFGDEGRLRAAAGCNTITGSYAVADAVLSFQGGGMTRMGCDPERHAQDDWLADFLATRPAVALAGDELLLTSGETSVRLVDRRVAEPDRPLAGPVWTVETIVDGDAAMSVPAGVLATLRFTDDGSVAIDAGCNQGGGAVTLGKDGTLGFDELVMTLRACEAPAAEVEGAVLGVLQAGPVRWSIDADVLTLTAGRHGLILRAR